MRRNLKRAGFAAVLLGMTVVADVLSSQALSAQPQEEIEFSCDLASPSSPLPALFLTAVDISGRGYHSDISWPQETAAREVLDEWQNDIGFRGLYRMQFNLWEISQLEKNSSLQARLLDNYEAVIKRISDAGGIVLLDIFSTPQGQGKVRDKKSYPVDLKVFKKTVKEYIAYFSCKKRYNVWYEVWTAPDLDDFFLGRKQEYLSLYRAVAESVQELEQETRVHIPVGGPSTAWWFRSCEGNTILTPERSLIYELIQFCYHHKLPLNFISWHAYSTDPKIEKETTYYNKTGLALIRDWLSYFRFPASTPLIVSEWNYDSGANVVSERKETSNVSASYIPARLRHMLDAGLDYQIFFSLEDFQDNREGVVRNVGLFWFEQNPLAYKGGSKATYTAMRMINALGPQMVPVSETAPDEYAGMIATKKDSSVRLLVYNYVDPEIVLHHLSRNLSLLNEKERQQLLKLLKSEKLEKILRKELDISGLKTSSRVKALLRKACELNDSAEKIKREGRIASIALRNANSEKYILKRYCADSSCSLNCGMTEVEEGIYSAKEPLRVHLEPYSVHLIVLEPAPEQVAEPAPVSEERVQQEQPQPKPESSEAVNATTGN